MTDNPQTATSTQLADPREAGQGRRRHSAWREAAARLSRAGSRTIS